MKMIKSIHIKNKYVKMYETNVISLSLIGPMYFIKVKNDKTFSEKYVYKRQEANDWFDIVTQTIV